MLALKSSFRLLNSINVRPSSAIEALLVLQNCLKPVLSKDPFLASAISSHLENPDNIKPHFERLRVLDISEEELLVLMLYQVIKRDNHQQFLGLL